MYICSASGTQYAYQPTYSKHGGLECGNSPKLTSHPHPFLLQFMSNLNCKTMKKTKQIQVKFFKEESIFNRIDRESLALYRQMMADRYGNFKEEEE